MLVFLFPSPTYTFAYAPTTNQKNYHFSYFNCHFSEIKADPRKYRHVLEFLYLLLQLGFKGKYGRAEQEKVALVDVKSKYLKAYYLQS